MSRSTDTTRISARPYIPKHEVPKARHNFPGSSRADQAAPPVDVDTALANSRLSS